MNQNQFFQNLLPPQGKVDVVLDTDAYNEIDDQFAIAYLLRSAEKLSVKAFYAAPFWNDLSTSPADGMEKSYQELFNLMKLADRQDMLPHIYRGAVSYLPDEQTPVCSDAVTHLIALADNYSPEHPLYVVAIGAITNIASALLLKPEIAEKIVVVWLGGHAHDFRDTHEFNMHQDIAAARVVFKSGAPLVQLPAIGVVSHLSISKPELLYWLSEKNPLADYLCKNTIQAADSYAEGKPWTRVIWDISAIAWLLDTNGKLMDSQIKNIRIPNYDNQYNPPLADRFFCYVDRVNRDAIFEDFIKKITQ